MLQMLGRLFGRDQQSKDDAKDRLQLLLVHDRAELSPRQMELLREDLVKVISKYFEIDGQTVQVNVDREERTMALVANVPIRQMKRGTDSGASANLS